MRLLQFLLLTVVILSILCVLFVIRASQSSKAKEVSAITTEITTNSKLMVSQNFRVEPKEIVLTPSPTRPPLACDVPQLISFGKAASASVRGNLGFSSVVTSEIVEDWLKDRWQAAKDMSGSPIPGAHWIEVDLEHVSLLDRVVIDWETAFSDQWEIKGRSSTVEEYETLATSKDAKKGREMNKHIIHEVDISGINSEAGKKEWKKARYIRLQIHRPSTRYGSSVWRLQVWGCPILNGCLAINKAMLNIGLESCKELYYSNFVEKPAETVLSLHNVREYAEGLKIPVDIGVNQSPAMPIAKEDRSSLLIKWINDVSEDVSQNPLAKANWVEIDLHLCRPISHIRLNWQVASKEDQWTVKGRCDTIQPFKELASSRTASNQSKYPNYFEVRFGDWKDGKLDFIFARYMRLEIQRPEKYQQEASLLRAFEIFGCNTRPVDDVFYQSKD